MNKLFGILFFLPSALYADAYAHPTFQVRLQTHLTSYSSPAGTGFSAIVIVPLEFGGQVLIPQGSIVRGTVRRTSRVGLGIVRERAAMELDFHEYELPNGKRYKLESKLDSIDNAKESVNKNGKIRGVLAANSPHMFFQGVWTKPDVALFQRSLLGLTGVAGRLSAAYNFDPFIAAGFFVFRVVAFRFAEPEIQLTPGTELNLSAKSIPFGAPTFDSMNTVEVEESLTASLRQMPFATRKPDMNRADDILNFAMHGSRKQLERAFLAAGWYPSDVPSRQAFKKAYTATTAMRAYPTAPVSKILYQGEMPELVFQKTLNTMGKRHHIRLWKRTAPNGEEIWVGAATHDIGVTFNARKASVTHNIDPQIDKERTKLINDLAFSGCIDSLGFVERAPARANGLKGIETDGRMAVVSIKDCSAREFASTDAPPEKPGTKASRLTRRLTLETKQYFLRGNIYYYAYRGVRHVGSSIQNARRQSEKREQFAKANAPAVPAPVLDAKAFVPPQGQ